MSSPQPLPALDERHAVVSEEPASAPDVATAAHARAAPRRRGGKRAAPTPPTRASDALFPPTDADRTPQTWLARLRQAEKPTPPNQARPERLSHPSTHGQPTRQRGQGKGWPDARRLLCARATRASRNACITRLARVSRAVTNSGGTASHIARFVARDATHDDGR